VASPALEGLKITTVGPMDELAIFIAFLDIVFHLVFVIILTNSFALSLVPIAKKIIISRIKNKEV
jgi:hypothetical protein